MLMRTTSKLVLVTLTAAIVLGSAVGTAGARRFELSNQAIRAIWPTFELSDVPLTRVSRCPITLEGSFHSRTLSKVCGQLVGYITEATTRKEGCGAEARSLWMDEGEIVTLPWHLRFESFTGALPNITTIRLQVIGLGVKFQGTRCEYKSEAMRPIHLIANLTGPTVTSLRFEEAGTIPLINLMGTCSPMAKLGGMSSPVFALATTTAISVRLVQ
jgi:hypothetical protein